MRAAPIGKQGKIGTARPLGHARHPGRLSPPGADRNGAVFAVSKGGRSKLIRAKLRAGKRGGSTKALLSSRSALIAGPSLAGKSIAYVLTTRKRQTVRIKGLGRGKGRALYRARRGPPTLWTTAIAGKRVLFTVLKRRGSGKILSVGR